VRQGATETAAKPATEHLALNTGTGDVKAQGKPVEVPKDLTWSDPKPMVQASNPSSKAERALVTLVQDGDTAGIRRQDGSPVNCRIDGIDAPETAKPWKGQPAQPMANESKKTLQDMIENKEVTVQVSYAKDKYGRNFCQIDIEGKNVSREMVRSGMAELYQRYAKDPQLGGIQNEAKSAKRGIWGLENYQRPEEFRHMKNWAK
jgi:endonuclease YncB( thermonuclease family)